MESYDGKSSTLLKPAGSSLEKWQILCLTRMKFGKNRGIRHQATRNHPRTVIFKSIIIVLALYTKLNCVAQELVLQHGYSVLPTLYPRPLQDVNQPLVFTLLGYL